MHQLGRVQAVPLLCELYPGICLTTEEKARKNLSQGSWRMPVGTMKTEYKERNRIYRTIQNIQNETEYTNKTAYTEQNRIYRTKQNIQKNTECTEQYRIYRTKQDIQNNTEYTERNRIYKQNSIYRKIQNIQNKTIY